MVEPMDHAHEADGLEWLADRVEAELERRPAVIRLTRIGWVAKGIVYATLAMTAALIAADARAASERDAGYPGFIAILAGDPWTRIGLIVIAVGLVLYVVYRLVSVALIDGDDADAGAHRIGYGFSAITYAVIAAIATRAAAVGALRRNDQGLVESTSAAVLEAPAGRILLAIAGVVTCGVAVYFAAKGVRRSFLDELELDGDHPAEQAAVVISGVVGWIGRGVLLVVIGAFVTWAAVTADASEARGLDQSLHRLADSSAGRFAVLGISVLLMFYAAFCILSARHQDPTWTPDHRADDALAAGRTG